MGETVLYRQTRAQVKQIGEKLLGGFE